MKEEIKREPMNSLAADEAMEFIRAFCIKCNRNVLLYGEPGWGKSEIVDRAARLEGIETLVSHPGVEEAVDIKGLPWGDRNGNGDHYATFLPFDNLSSVITGDKPMLWHLEDFGLAMPSTQGAYMQAAQRRAIGQHRIRDNVSIVITTNDISHGSGVTPILETIKSRFTMIRLKPDHDAWCGWAMENGVPPWIIAWVKREPHKALPIGWEPRKSLVAQPNPRNLYEVGLMVNAGIIDPRMWAGRIGDAAATDCYNFYRLAEKAPDPTEIIKAPTTVPVPDDPSMAFCAVFALAAVCKRNSDWSAALAWTNRCGKDYETLFVKSSWRSKPDVVGRFEAFTKWTLDPVNAEIVGVLNKGRAK